VKSPVQNPPPNAPSVTSVDSPTGPKLIDQRELTILGHSARKFDGRSGSSYYQIIDSSLLNR